MHREPFEENTVAGSARQYSKKLIVTNNNEYYTEPEDDYDEESTYSPKPIGPSLAITTGGGGGAAAETATNKINKLIDEDNDDIEDDVDVYNENTADEDNNINNNDEDVMDDSDMDEKKKSKHHNGHVTADGIDDDDDETLNTIHPIVDEYNFDEKTTNNKTDDSKTAATKRKSIQRKRTKSICEGAMSSAAITASTSSSSKLAAKRRRQTIDTMDIKKRVLEHSATSKDIPSKLMESFSLNKQVIVDYNLLSYCEQRPVDLDDNIMEARMTRFIEKIKTNYKGVQHIEYKINNKLFCVLDIVYFLPILFRQHENNERAELNHKMLISMIDRLDLLSEKVLGPNVPSVMPSSSSSSDSRRDHDRNTSPSTPKSSLKKPASSTKTSSTTTEKTITFKIPTVPKKKSSSSSSTSSSSSASSVALNSSNSDSRNIRLYLIGSDYYLMCRKRQNFVDGQKNLEKKYGHCKLLKTWNNRTNVKEIGKLIHRKFPQLQWNARTNIITNSPDKAVTENELLTYISKVID